MDMPVPSLDEIEALELSNTDEFARMRRWNDHYLTDPVDDLDVFFAHIPGRRMLDVGCGWARYVQRFLDRGLEYSGIDFSAEMLKVARESFPSLRFEQTSFRNVGMFADESFDGLWCCCVFGGEPKDNMQHVLQGLHRLLVPGGVMAVIMPAVGPSEEVLILDVGHQPTAYHSSYDQRELEEMLIHAGFEIIESQLRFQAGAISILVRK